MYIWLELNSKVSCPALPAPELGIKLNFKAMKLAIYCFRTIRVLSSAMLKEFLPFSYVIR